MQLYSFWYCLVFVSAGIFNKHQHDHSTSSTSETTSLTSNHYKVSFAPGFLLKNVKQKLTSLKFISEPSSSASDTTDHHPFSPLSKSNANLSENCLFGTGMPQYWPQGGAVVSTAPHLLGQEASIRGGATPTS